MQDYPAHWATDVVLADGATAHVRPIMPSDADRMVAFYERVSDQSKYYRFFAPYPRLSDRDIHRFTEVDHVDRVALIALVGDQMIGIGRYDRLGGDDAEVAFLVEDSQHGRGVGSLLLEQLAQAARERGVAHFVAEVLPENRKMIQVFRDAGYQVANSFQDGVMHLEFAIDPTADSLEVMQSREHRAEARSIERLLTPRSVAVVGASRSRDTVGQTLVRNLVAAGFTGRVYAVNPHTDAVAGVPAYPSLRDLPGAVDLAIVAVPPEAVPDIVLDAAHVGVRGLVVVSAGYAETGPEGRERQETLVRLARANGMRVLGPNCLGLINTDPAFALNASLAQRPPQPGRIGFFAQSGALGTAVLEQLAARGIGLSSFVSAGNRADVSGNDFMQFWDSDQRTDVVLLYLESIGNPRKFSRIARRIARSKPIVAVKSGRATQGVPLGHAVRSTDAPPAAVDALFRQAGVIGVDTLPELLDVAQLLAFQPLPRGWRVAVVGNSDAIGLLVADAAASAGLDIVTPTRDLGAAASPTDYKHALAELLGSPDVDSVVVTFASAVVEASSATAVADVIAAAAAGADKPVVATFLGASGVRGPLRRTDEQATALPGSVPSYPSPEEAVRALAHVTAYSIWRRRPPGVVPDVDGIDEIAARALVERVLADRPDGGQVEQGQLVELLGHYGIELLTMMSVATVGEAVAAAERLGYDVVLKATAQHLRHRPDLADVWRNIDSSAEMRSAWATMSQTLADPAEAGFVVQRMAPPGLPVIVRAREDQLFGPIVSFGVAGITTELLGDRAFRIPPLTDVDAAEMVREVQAAPLLFGYRGAEPADVTAIEDLLHRVSRLTDDLPEVSALELDPVLVGVKDLSVVNAVLSVAPPQTRSDWYSRRLG